MRLLAVVFVALFGVILASDVHGYPATTGAKPQGQAHPATPIPHPAAPASGPYAKCDGSIRDHRTRSCEVHFPLSCDQRFPFNQVTRCGIVGTLPPGCFCTCDVLCDTQSGRRQTFPGEIVLGQ